MCCSLHDCFPLPVIGVPAAGVIRAVMASGKVETVCGSVDPQALSATMTHEHLFHKATSSLFAPRPPDPRYAALRDSDMTVHNLWWIVHHPYSHVSNLTFDDSATKDVMIEELKFFKKNGGGSIVECTTFGKDLQFFKSLSVESGVNIVAGTGYYVNMSQPAAVHAKTVEQIYNEMKEELFVGEDGIKCGIIGEIGTCFPIHDFEAKVIRAAANVQSEKKSIPVSIHPGRDPRAPFEVVRIFLEAGGSADKLVMCHLERTLMTNDLMFDFAKHGTFLEFDLFGIENSYYELSDELEMPSDSVRIARLKELIDEGYGNKLLISMDIHTKQRLMAFGGHGFSHILLNTVPKMKMRGFSQDNIDDILINNPRTWLTL